MCGICGKLNYDRSEPVSEELIRRMNRTIAHRGPDDSGVYVRGRVGLGMQRLAIIDLSPSAHQPMSNEDGTIWIVYNGEVYNFPELREELIRRGHTFRSNSDTEVVIHLYEEHGEECVGLLRGMFAFALWDENRQKLLMARDRLGQKPLLYADTGRSLVFGSEMRSLLLEPSVSREIDPLAIHHYLTYSYILQPRSIFKSVKKLPPAHVLTWEDGRIEVKRYWQLHYTPKTSLSKPECEERIRELLSEATKMRMISDVPLGAFLSGGIDSAAVVAMMARHSSGPVKTFSIGFEEQTFSELHYARIVAERFGTEHHEFIVRPEAVEVLPLLAWHYGEPYADSSALPTYHVAKMTRQHVTVALNGDAGDETFAGYERYAASRISSLYRKIPGAVREWLIRRPAELLPETTARKDLARRVKRFARGASLSPVETYASWMTTFDADAKASLYSPGFAALTRGHDSIELLQGAYSRSDTPDFIDSTLFVDTHTYLPDDLLVKVDIATMAVSLEGRSPFLDHKLMEFAASLPISYKLHGMENKHILKRALRGILPEAILRRDKQGFGIPLADWFRGELRGFARDLLLGEPARSRGYFDAARVENILEEHAGGQANHGYRIWSLVMLELWHRTYIDREDVTSPLASV